MTLPLLVARELGYTYPDGGIVALHNLNLTITKGRKLAILGSNGSGKTTFLLHLNGILRPTCGEILLDGHKVSYNKPSLYRWRARVGLVLQEPDDQLFAATVEQDVAFGPLNLGLNSCVVRERVQQVLDTLHIGHLAKCATHTLSFGQKKRVSIAGILAMYPEILVLDEPTAGLDSHGIKYLLNALQSLYETGTTLVFSTHDVDLVYTWADEVALFHEGTVIGQGDTVNILNDKLLLSKAQLLTPFLLEIAETLSNTSNIFPRSREEILAILRTNSK